MKKTITISAAAVASVITLAGCSSGGGNGGASGMPDTSSSGSSTTTSATAASSPAAADGHSAADTSFAQVMLPHHKQAVAMSNVILEKQGIDPRVSDLATRIKAEQTPEIDKLTGWLKDWNEPAAMGGSMDMSGMMSAADMKKLDAAQGTDATKLFLNQMVMHHEGAVAMAKTEQDQGKNPDAVILAKSIIASQESEIKEMKNLLTAP